jgi:GGDEF domain-containing protein
MAANTSTHRPAGMNSEFHLPNQINTDEWMNHPIAVAQRLVDDQERKIKEVTDQAKIDKKTGLLVQEAWMDNLSNTLENLQPGESAFAGIADVNGFKEVNDTLGHAAGDELLGIVGEVFRRSFLRTTDVLTHGSRDEPTTHDENNSIPIDKQHIARLGGDEYAVFIHNKVPASEAISHERRHTDPEDIDSLRNTLNERVNGILKELIRGTKFEQFEHLGISIGIAKYEAREGAEPGSAALDLFALADYDMFTVKAQGKIANLKPDDIEQLRRIVPYLESIHARVDGWLKQAIEQYDAAS